jgi:hypothetical protein
MGPAQVFLDSVRCAVEGAELAMLSTEGDNAVVQKVLKRGNSLCRTSPISFATSQAGCEYIASTGSASCLANSQIFTGQQVLHLPWMFGSLPAVKSRKAIEPADAYQQALEEIGLRDPEIGTDFGPSGRMETRCQREHRNSSRRPYANPESHATRIKLL